MNARLYLVLTPAACRTAPADVVAAALDGGVDLVQFREKLVDDDAFVAAARPLAELCRARGVPFLVNDRVHLVAACGADGVHVGEDDLLPEEARARLPDGAVVGLSTHDRAEVAAAAARGVDYVGLGPCYATATKALARAPRGPGLVRAAQGATALPVFPIGGITPANAPDLVAAGAVRLAVGAAITASADPRAAARALRAALTSAAGPAGPG